MQRGFCGHCRPQLRRLGQRRHGAHRRGLQLRRQQIVRAPQLGALGLRCPAPDQRVRPLQVAPLQRLLCDGRVDLQKLPGRRNFLVVEKRHGGIRFLLLAVRRGRRPASWPGLLTGEKRHDIPHLARLENPKHRRHNRNGRRLARDVGARNRLASCRRRAAHRPLAAFPSRVCPSPRPRLSTSRSRGRSPWRSSRRARAAIEDHARHVVRRSSPGSGPLHCRRWARCHDRPRQLALRLFCTISRPAVALPPSSNSPSATPAGDAV